MSLCQELILRTEMDKFLRRADSLTVQQAANCIHYVFNKGEGQICIDQKHTTLNAYCTTALTASLPAKNLHFWFLGGPGALQGKGKWFKGSLLTMLLDLYLRALGRHEYVTISQFESVIRYANDH